MSAGVLRPFLLADMSGESGRPWGFPGSEGDEGPFAEDEEFRAMLAPFGPGFPGLATVLRSWEDRFGARLLEVGFAGIRLLVSRPPCTLEAALPIAAEQVAFSDEAHGGLYSVGEIARALVGNPFWDFWWD